MISTVLAGFASTTLGGGGGAVLAGEATVWPDVASSANLSSIASPRTGDRCVTTDTGFTWEYSGSAWEIVYGTVTAAASLPSSNVAGSALIGVGTDGVSSHTWYGRHSGAWARTPRPSTYARTLSSLQDVLVTDLDGDYGLYVGSDGSSTLRLKRGISLPGGATANLWVPPAVYAGTITARAYALGTESNTGLSTTLATQGWTLVVGGAGAITATGSVVQCQSSGGGGTAILRTLVSSLTTTSNVYFQGDVAITIGSAGNCNLYTTDGTNIGYFSQNNISAASATWIRANTSSTDAATNAYRNGAATALPTVASGNRAAVQFMDQGTVMATMWRDGAMYHAARRPFTAGSFGNFWSQGVSTGAGGTPSTITFRNCYVLTWV